MRHFFSVNIAKMFSVNEAILLENIKFWIDKNKANKKHFHDGRYWTYNSVKAFSELFPYWTAKQIEKIISKLCDNGLIEKGNYNSSKYDRTMWYSLTDLAESLFHMDTMHFPKKENGNLQKVEPIPDVKQDIKHIYKKNTKKDDESPTSNVSQINQTKKDPLSPEGDLIVPNPPSGGLKTSKLNTKNKKFAQKVADEYNEILGKRLPQVKVLTDKRIKSIIKLSKLLREPTVNAFKNYFHVILAEAKEFYFGENERKWVSSFDFWMRESSFVGIKEGTMSKN